MARGNGRENEITGKTKVSDRSSRAVAHEVRAPILPAGHRAQPGGKKAGAKAGHKKAVALRPG